MHCCEASQFISIYIKNYQEANSIHSIKNCELSLNRLSIDEVQSPEKENSVSCMLNWLLGSMRSRE